MWQCKTMLSGPPEFIPPFIPVPGKVSVHTAKFPARLPRSREPSQPALSYEHIRRKFYKGIRGKARSRKPGQPGQPGLYERPLVVDLKDGWERVVVFEKMETWNVADIKNKMLLIKCSTFSMHIRPRERTYSGLFSCSLFIVYCYVCHR